MMIYKFYLWIIFLTISVSICSYAAPQKIFDVKEYVVTAGDGEATHSIQKVIDKCAASGGGTVYIHAGEYLSGTIFLRSNIRLYVENGVVLNASRHSNDFKKNALIYGEDLENIAIEGVGVINGGAEYEWRQLDVSEKIPECAPEDFSPTIKRPYPIPPTPKMIVLVNCQNVRIKDITIRNSPSWTIHPWGCDNVRIDGVTIENNLTEGAWTDGINPDCCRDVHISDCTITAGDDAIALKTTNRYGKAKPCENITVSNCRFTSASCGFKIGTETNADIRHIVVNNCIIRNSNRGIGIIVRDSAMVNDVIFSNLNIECRRHDYFWWGNGDPIFFVSWPRKGVLKPGVIKNVLVTNTIAHSKGMSLIEGLSDISLQNISLQNVHFIVSSDAALDFPLPDQPYTYEHYYHTKIFPSNHKCQSFGRYVLKCFNIKDLKLTDVEVDWEGEVSRRWENALFFEHITDLILKNFQSRQPHKNNDEESAIVLKDNDGIYINGCKADLGTGIFLKFAGKANKNIFLQGNYFQDARKPISADDPILNVKFEKMKTF